MWAKRKEIIAWEKAHKKEILITFGITLFTLLLFLIRLKSEEELDNCWQSLKNGIKEGIDEASESDGLEESVSEKSDSSSQNCLKQNDDLLSEEFLSPVTLPEKTRNAPVGPVDVSMHLRNLPEGRHASEEKINSAKERGYSLEEGQTWVDSYTKYKSKEN